MSADAPSLTLAEEFLCDLDEDDVAEITANSEQQNDSMMVDEEAAASEASSTQPQVNVMITDPKELAKVLYSERLEALLKVGFNNSVRIIENRKWLITVACLVQTRRLPVAWKKTQSTN